MTTTGSQIGTDWLDRRIYPFKSHWTHVEGGRMHYIDEGEGDPILFVHGMPTWSFMFRSPIQELSVRHRCVAVDHIGFGLSDKPSDFDYYPSKLCKNLAKLIEELDLWNVTLVAHDYGGPIAVSYTLENLSRVKRLVLSNTWFSDLRYDSGAQKIAKSASGSLGKFLYVQTNLGAKMMKPLICQKTLWTESVQRAYSGPFLKKSDRTGPWMLAKHLHDSSPWFEALWGDRDRLQDLPMLLLWGMHDPTFGERYLNKIWHEFPLAEVQTYPDAGHFVWEDRPSELTQRLKSFAGMGAGATYLA